ncbi:MAG: transcription elongation factor GreA [Clostridia bacterium]|nr:transcription elongation factor GreA [Clostridia bacterium]
MAETNFTLYTKEGFQQLVDELAYLKDVRVPEIKIQLAEARSHGDLSENSEYDEARDAQAKCYARIAEVEELIKHAKVIDESDYKVGVVSIGSLVKVYDKTFDEECEYTIVGSNEVNAFLNMITDHSPIGQALMGTKAGETVKYTAPCGEVELEVLSVERAKKN